MYQIKPYYGMLFLSTNNFCYLGYIDLLAKLTVTGIVTKQMYASKCSNIYYLIIFIIIIVVLITVIGTFNQMKHNNGIYYIIVIKDTQVNRIVASGSLILEKKFIHSCGQVRYKLSFQNIFFVC